ncbi:MAG: type II secretion system protein [Armatimonadota bacterium]
MGVTRQRAQARPATTRRVTARSGPSRGGFTLTELLVVIGIAVLLMALLIPTGQSLRAGNRALTCKSQLQQIGTALQAYYYDEGGAPPFYIEGGQDPNDPLGNPPTGPGLMALYDMGYLSRRESLHCPRDVYAAQADSTGYYESYQRYDEDAFATVGLNKYSYLSTRGVTDPIDPFYRRQLMPADDTTVPPLPMAIGPHDRPADNAVITWCPFHADEIEVGGEGAYQVLFWDGSVQRVRESVMTDDEYGPEEAWQVSHEDAG